ncbi:CmpA/NrtA family ABC transporter substrate-binding protein [Chromohalobacter israelensis]|uniref:CmpA/NrtA family ABC transporter substrate-binding protein n=1 Tax=Chromohalobacter israelensis TaxID=141390 RepID=UPI003AF671AA
MNDRQTPRDAWPSPELDTLTLGMLPLNDAAPLVVARERGFFAEQGLDVTLSVESSWAGMRDAMQLALLDGAQMLPLMPLASTLGLDGRRTPMLSALTLSLGGNAITVSNALYDDMLAADPDAMAASPTSARALATVVRQRRERGAPPLRFASVYPFSSHRYLLRYWLAEGGVDPDRDLELRVVPPPLVAQQLEAGWLDGYCVGEPWNTLAARRERGRVLIGSHAIWQNGQEKVFAVREEWAQAYPATHRAVLRALLKACAWLEAPAHRGEAARLMCERGYLDVAPSVVEDSMLAEGASLTHGMSVFHRHAANFPWRSHLLWYAGQMRRWQHLDVDDAVLDECLSRCVRPDLFREAADDLGINYPLVDAKSEGEHGGAWVMEGRHGPLDMGGDRLLGGARFAPFLHS